MNRKKRKLYMYMSIGTEHDQKLPPAIIDIQMLDDYKQTIL